MKLFFLGAVVFVMACFHLSASEEDISPKPQINILRQVLLQHYDNPLLKKPLTLHVSAKNLQLETMVIVYENQVFEVPAKLTAQITVQNLHQTYVSCEAGYPKVGGFTIYINIPGSHRSMLDPWYKLAWNKAGFFLYLKHGDKNNRKTETLVPFSEAVKIPSVPLAEWREKHPNVTLNQ